MAKSTYKHKVTGSLQKLTDSEFEKLSPGIKANYALDTPAPKTTAPPEAKAKAKGADKD